MQPYGGSRGGITGNGSRMAGSRLAGSRLTGSALGGSRIAGSKLGGSRMAGSKLTGSRMAQAGYNNGVIENIKTASNRALGFLYSLF